MSSKRQQHQTLRTTRQHSEKGGRPSQPRKLKRVIIREEFVALTADYKKAVLLHQLEYRQSQAYDLDRYLEEENERLTREGDVSSGTPPEPSCGWFQCSAGQLSEETFLRISDSSILTHLQYFINHGWLQERSNPKQKWDRKKQYRLDLLKLKEDLEEIGYQLEGWMLDSLSASSSTFSFIENASAETENGASEIEARTAETEDRTSKTEEQYINTLSEHENKHTTKHREILVPPAKDPAPQGATRCVSVSSKFTFEECLEFARHLHRTGQGITNPGGYATAIYRSGEADAMIGAFRRPQFRPESGDILNCPDCRGTGYWYPAEVAKGVIKCKHAKLHVVPEDRAQNAC